MAAKKSRVPWHVQEARRRRLEARARVARRQRRLEASRRLERLRSLSKRKLSAELRRHLASCDNKLGREALAEMATLAMQIGKMSKSDVKKLLAATRLVRIANGEPQREHRRISRRPDM